MHPGAGRKETRLSGPLVSLEDFRALGQDSVSAVHPAYGDADAF
jgi:hypothetical protein